jgi:endonuclease/exonuclease/phosphatase family metal-dependent hydrolase
MPSYWPIRRQTDDVIRVRTIDRVLALRAKLQAEVGIHAKPGSFLLATWNIREFGKLKPKHDPRIDESFHYLAEIISHFHLVALQEVNRDLKDFERLMHLLGPDWQCLLTDTTEGTSGNEERMAYVYDRRFVQFRNVAGEIVLPVGRKKEEDDADVLQFARTPFAVAFQAGWLKFNLCTVHIYYGQDTGAKLARRVAEIEAIAKFFKDRQKKEAQNYILLGDFNIISPEHQTMAALKKHGFTVPENLQKEKSNLIKTKHYDQIALKPLEKIIEIGASGVFAFDDVVFRPTVEDRTIYKKFMSKAGDKTGEDLTKYYDTWRSFQMSDHLPMWAELKVDFTEDYLDSLRPGEAPLGG